MFSYFCVSMLFKSLIKIKIQFESRLHYIDIIAYQCTKNKEFSVWRAIINWVRFYSQCVPTNIGIRRRLEDRLWFPIKSEIQVLHWTIIDRNIVKLNSLDFSLIIKNFVKFMDSWYCQVVFDSSIHKIFINIMFT